jgi:hypothetical protein
MTNFSLKCVHLRLQQGTQQAQTLHLFPYCTVLYFNPCCHLPDLYIIFFWWTHRFYHLFLLIEAAHGQPLWGRLLMSVPVFKVVYHCLTLLFPIQSSRYSHWSCVWISDGDISPSAHNSMTAHCMSLPAILLRRNITIWQWGRQHDFYSKMKHWMDVVIIYCVLQYCRVFVNNSPVLITFFMTLIHIAPHENTWYVLSVQNFLICYD